MKVIYFGYDTFLGCLKAVLDNPKYEIVKIYSFESDGFFDFNDKTRALAMEHNIEFTTEKITSQELIKQVNENGCEFLFCAGYAYRIPIESVNVTAVNIHPSPLPKGRGPWPMPWAILKREKTWGVTAHKLAPKIDEGDILFSDNFALDEKENYTSLISKIESSAEFVTKTVLSNLNKLWQNAKKQQNGEYLPEPSDELRTIYIDTPEEKRQLLIRAFGENYVIYSENKETVYTTYYQSRHLIKTPVEYQN